VDRGRGGEDRCARKASGKLRACRLAWRGGRDGQAPRPLAPVEPGRLRAHPAGLASL
jgi:hypothetical protein